MAYPNSASLRQNSADASTLNIVDAYPRFFLNAGTGQVLPSLRTDAYEQPHVPVEVQVKNTFIHFDDEDFVMPFRRSKSDKQSDRPSAPRRVHYDEGLNIARGASSSAQDATMEAPVMRCRSDKSSDRPSAPWPISRESFDPVPGASSLAHDTATCPPMSPMSGVPAVSEPADPDGQDQNVQDARAEWSIGSAEHEAGHCKPCTFHAYSGCTRGSACRFCHLPHQRRARIRPCKAKREQCKQIAASLGSVDMDNQVGAEDQLRRMCLESGGNRVDTSYLLRIVRSQAQISKSYHEQPEDDGPLNNP